MTDSLLGSITDPVALVPGSVAALDADADDLDRQATSLIDASADVRHQRTAAWSGVAADGWAELRAQLAVSLETVGRAFSVAAGALRSHARVLAWAQQRAEVAVRLWQAGDHADAAAGNQYPPLPFRAAAQPRLTVLFERPAALDTSPGAAYRDRARVVLAQARMAVGDSASAVAKVLDEMSAGLPDGRFHADQFLAGIGDWAYGIGELFFKFNSIRAIVDGDGMAADVSEIVNGALDTADYLSSNPDQFVPVVLNTQQMHDNPGRWAGNLFPDAALTFVAGAGALSKGLGVLRTGLRAADDVGDTARFAGGLPIGNGSIRSIVDQLADPHVHPTNAFIVPSNYNPFRGSRTAREFIANHSYPDASGEPSLGDWRWPGNNGAVPGTESTRTLTTGDNLAVDRIGRPTGTYFAPRDTSFELRSLPPDRLNFPRTTYEIDTSHPLVQAGRITVEESRVARAFGQDGGGMQYRFFSNGVEMTQGDLVSAGVLVPTS